MLSECVSAQRYIQDRRDMCRKKPHHKLPNPKRNSRLPNLNSKIKELGISC
jgi:hypothetical protein